MVEQIVGNIEVLLTPEESILSDAQVAAQASGEVTKADADYQNDPHGDEQCSKCAMFVPGFPNDAGGFCTKVKSYRGPAGVIFADGWCKFFEQNLDDAYAEAGEGESFKPDEDEGRG